MSLRRVAVAVAVSCAIVAPALTLVARGQVAGQGTQVSGRVLSSSGSGAAGTPLRLRNVDTGTIASEVRSDGSGAFSFTAPGPGLYVVEAMNAEGRVAAVGGPVNVINSPVTVNLTLPSNNRIAAAWLVLGIAAAGAGVTAWALGTGQSEPVPVSPEQ